MGGMAGQALAGGRWRMLHRPPGKFTVIMTGKAQLVRANDKQRVHLGTMPNMAGQTFPLPNRYVDAPHFLVLSLVMALQAECFWFLGQHVDIIAGMGGVAIRTVSHPERFMKAGSHILFFMTVTAEYISVFRHNQFTVAVHLVTGPAITVRNRFMDNRL